MANISLEKKRGFEPQGNFPGRTYISLVKADVQAVATAMSHLLYGTQGKIKDVTNTTTLNSGESFTEDIVSQFQGHLWAENWGILSQENAHNFSRQLETSVIYFEYEDVSDTIYYALFDKGNLIEEYEHGEDFSIYMEEEHSIDEKWDVAVLDGESKYLFRSTMQTVTEAEIKQGYKFLDMLFRFHNVYMPDWSKSLKFSADDFAGIYLIESGVGI